MGIGLSASSVTTYLIALVILIVIGILLVTFFKLPLKLLSYLAVNGIIGGCMLFASNFVLASFGMNLPVNPLNAAVCGFLGVPGLITLYLIKYLF